MNNHASDLTEDEEGWLVARCACGWTFGAVPGNEEAMDVLMDHAYETGYAAGIGRANQSLGGES